ncbi:hypothetical protein [Leptolyngbya sp. 7M]|uniref:Uncharacterized protein n=1 Tax=Leptolyngbya sp. NK1-12 TaxID=2547451 RepID=A0AA96WBR3_9CYAN|nr:hypothetical protein [Leptolyngbya sp. 7M]QYO62112.1 hypothetical protein JVX88_18510 [Leptolyngbya sp. 7M]RNJ64741.1 MAG: hypothetical protein EDM05_34895 [Leptolyngbya sp. IPPAS B-1204]WNZ22194.1 hypothetical protein HJG54_04500 [Leptolyngbya sp. NK1-12]
MEGCAVTDLKVDSKRNCFFLDAGLLQRIQQETAVSTRLEPGTNVVKIRAGAFNYQSNSGHQGEPMVLLWIYGGKVINKKTGIPVGATWSTLNGYDDTLTLEVLEPATLCAFFFDTYLEDNDGEVHLSVVRI